MSRYDPLTQYLASQPADKREVRMWFRELEQVVGALPPSARNQRTWWANSTNAQAVSWQRAGWKVDTVILTNELVVFVRGQAERRSFSTPIAPVSRAPIEDSVQTEAEVQAQLVAHLAAQGWQIRQVANTATKEHGIDVIAHLDGRTLAIEVKGYPSDTYADPRRANEIKPTIAANQARHWFSHALLKVLLMRDEHPDYEIAMAFPDMPTYRRLATAIGRSLEELSVAVIFVTPDGLA